MPGGRCSGLPFRRAVRFAAAPNRTHTLLSRKRFNAPLREDPRVEHVPGGRARTNLDPGVDGRAQFQPHGGCGGPCWFGSRRRLACPQRGSCRRRRRSGRIRARRRGRHGRGPGRRAARLKEGGRLLENDQRDERGDRQDADPEDDPFAPRLRHSPLVSGIAPRDKTAVRTTSRRPK